MSPVVVVEWVDGRCVRCDATLGHSGNCDNCLAAQAIQALAEPEPPPPPPLERGDYLKILSDLINRDPSAKERARRVRGANQRLYSILVEPEATAIQADLALAAAADKERR